MSATQFVCETCTYPFPEGVCRNPTCEANPSVTQAQKDAWKAARDKAAADEAERERWRQVRRRAMGW